MKHMTKLFCIKLGLCVMAGFILTAFIHGFHSWLDFVRFSGLSIASMMVFNHVMHRKEIKYTKRIESSDSIEWDVHANQVKVGVVTDAQYATMQLHALRSGDVAMAQLFNVGAIILTLLRQIAVLVPLVCFWLGAGTFIFNPDAYIVIIKALQQADTTKISSEVHSLLKTAITGMWLLQGYNFFWGTRNGFVNYYAKSVSDALRLHCGAPIDGSIHLQRYINANQALSSKLTP